MSTKLYLCGDTGPSGFGVATRYFLKHLLREDPDDFEVTARTHFWGLNREGIKMQNGGLPDTRFQEWLLRTDTVNEDYLIDDPRDMATRGGENLTDNLGTNETVDSEQCIVRQFDGPEDIWLAVGGAAFADQAPDDAYTIVSTDFNLDLVPRDWEYYLDQVDEMWVPSGWTRNAVLDRVGDEYDDVVYRLPYGIGMDYEPAEYDCEVCAHNQGQGGRPPQAACLRDDAVTFGMVSRWYHIKGIYRALRAYVEEFRRGDDVRLFIKTTSNQQFQFAPAQATQQLINGLGYPDPPEIGFATESLETQHLYNLLGEFDAFIQPSRAECFGLAQLQAAYCETPVIYTDWSAQRELLDARNEGFLPIKRFHVDTPQQEFPYLPYDVHGSYPPDANWAVPSIDAIQARLREVYEMTTQERNRRGREAREWVEQEYQWSDRFGQRLARLREIAETEVGR